MGNVDGGETAVQYIHLHTQTHANSPVPVVSFVFVFFKFSLFVVVVVVDVASIGCCCAANIYFKICSLLNFESSINKIIYTKSCRHGLSVRAIVLCVCVVE